MEENCTNKKIYLHDFTYNGIEISVSEAKEVLSKFADDSGSVNFEEDYNNNGIARICLNNPRVKNAISRKMMFELEEIINKLDELETEYKGVIIYGANGTFCSGSDLNIAKKISNPEMGFAMTIYMNNILEKLRKLPLITVAYIEGMGALGGGAEIATACDYRLMTEGAVIGFVHAKMGLTPAWGSTGRLMSIVGYHKALKLLLECQLLSATEANDIGLADGTADTLTDAVAWLSQKTVHDINVIRAIKRTLTCYDDTLDWQRASLMERRIFAPLWGGEANRMALAKGLKHKK